MFKKSGFIFIVLIVIFFWHLDVSAVAKSIVCSCNVTINYKKITIDVKSGESTEWPKVYESEHIFKIEEGVYSKITFTGEPEGVDEAVDFPSGIEPKCDTCEKDFALELADSIEQGKKSSLMNDVSATCKKYVCEDGGNGTYTDCKEFVGSAAWKEPNPFPTQENPAVWSSIVEKQLVELKLQNSLSGKIECAEGCGVLEIVQTQGAGGLWAPNAKVTFFPKKVPEINKVFYSTFKVTLPQNAGTKCANSSALEDKYFFKVSYFCGEATKGKDCNDPTQLESCKKACPAEYCEFDGKSCVAKKQESVKETDTGAVKEQGAGLSTMEYNPEYFKNLNPKPKDYVGALPECAFSGTCRNTNDLVQLIINFGQGMFAILGSFAFVFFVYGGFTIILSMGNAEKVNKGKQILGAAIVGLVVAFCAYLLIDFMLEALQVKDAFKGIK